MMVSELEPAIDRLAPRKRCGAAPPKTMASSPLRSIRLCDEASLLLRNAGWRKGDLQRRLAELARDAATLSSVDVALAKDLGERERHKTRATSARVEHSDYEKLRSMAAAGGVSAWAFMNQAIIDKYGRPSSL